MDGIVGTPADESVSPYLKRPLRSLSKVLAGRRSDQKEAPRDGEAPRRDEAQPVPRAPRDAADERGG